MINETIRSKSKTRFIKYLSEDTGGNISEACKLVGFSRQTINEWRYNDPDFDHAVEEAILAGKETLADLAETYLHKRIREGDTTAIIFTLKSLRRRFFGDRLETIGNRDEGPALKQGTINSIGRLWLRTSNLELLNPSQRQQLNSIIEILEANKSDNINEDDKS